MSLASSWMDMVVGIDIHLELVPMPAPTPTPFPHPFVGLVFDPVGMIMGEITAALMALATGAPPQPTGLVLIGVMPATCTGDEVSMPVPHIFIPPGVSWAPVPRMPAPKIGLKGKIPLPDPPIPPPSDAVLLMGSQTITVRGSNPVRMGEMALSCSDPVRMPTSSVIAIPKGPSITMMGGPPGICWDEVTSMIAGKALRNKWTAGKLHKGIDKVLPFAPKRMRNMLHKGACFLTGHPVNVANGTVLTSGVDFELPGPIPLQFERNYCSNWFDRDSPLGHGWSHTYDSKIWHELDTIVVQTGDGRELEFHTHEFPDRVMRAGHELHNPIERVTLRSKGQFRWELEFADGVVHEFSPIQGEAQAHRDRGMSRLVKIRDRVGEHVVLRYDERANLAEIVDSVQRTVKFEYDARGRIKTVWMPSADGKGWRQHASYAYSPEGDLIEAKDAVGKPMRFVYDDHLLVQETNRNGLSFYFKYDGYGRHARCTRTWGDDGIYDHLISYDKEGMRTTVEDSLGNATVYALHPLGTVEEITDARGGVTKFEYDEAVRKVAEIDPLGNKTAYTYDERGNQVMVVGPDKAVTKIRYDAQNNPVGVVTPTGAEWAWTYDRYGRVTSRTNPIGQRKAYVYDGKRLTATHDASGAKTVYEWDRHANLIAVTTPDGAKSQWRHDALGRVVVSMDPRGNQQRRAYDGLGRLVRIEEPDGNIREVAYDGEGNVVRARDRLRDVSFAYQGMNKLASRSIGGTTVRFEYDKEERLTAVTNEKGDVHRFELDGEGDVLREVGFDGFERQFVRDPAGRALVVMRPGGKTTSYTYDAAGRVTDVVHSEGDEEHYVYDPVGNVLEVANGSCTVEFERDALGRVVKESQGDHWVASQYDHHGLRIGLESSLGAHQSLRRNAMGDVEHVSFRSEAQTWEATFGRDVMGLEVDRKLPGNARSYWWRDKLGRGTQHWVGRDKATHRMRKYAWDVDDRITSITEEGRGPIGYEHDARGFLVRGAHAGGYVDERNPDEVGNLFRTRQRTDREYGRAGQILVSRDAKGAETRYRYDEGGNLIEKIDPDGAKWRYHWNGAGMLEQVDRPDGLAVAFAYDPLGRRISKNFAGKVTRWVWDGNNPLHEWSEAGDVPERRLEPEETARLAAMKAGVERLRGDGGDDLDARIERMLELQDEKFEHVVAEVRRWVKDGPAKPPDDIDEAVITWLFDAESFSPMARVTDAEAQSIVCDHLGTPLCVLGADGGVKWQGSQDTYGRVAQVGDGGLCPWRFPGQYADEETGLYYNRWRYYDPGSGTYTSRDPLGLLSEPTYGYVLDPVGWIDPFGLAAQPGGCGTSPTITAAELEGKTRAQIESMASNKGLIPFGQPDPVSGRSRKWKDPVTGKQRLRLDRGHVDPQTGLPYNDPKARVDHVHGYEPDGSTKIRAADGNPHFPTTGE